MILIFLKFYINSIKDGYELGGLATSVKRDAMDGGGLACRGKSYKENHCLYPGDLYPFTRRPLFIIIDSDNSFVFQHIPRYFGQPLVVLMSPQDVPPPFQGIDLQILNISIILLEFSKTKTKSRELYLSTNTNI